MEIITISAWANDIPLAHSSDHHTSVHLIAANLATLSLNLSVFHTPVHTSIYLFRYTGGKKRLSLQLWESRVLLFCHEHTCVSWSDLCRKYSSTGASSRACEWDVSAFYSFLVVCSTDRGSVLSERKTAHSPQTSTQTFFFTICDNFAMFTPPHCHDQTGLYCTSLSKQS